MGELSTRNFGLLIAYVVPGFLVLWALGLLDDRVTLWLEGPVHAGPSIGGVLYVTVASIGLGMAASAVRWVVVDTLHVLSGLRRPPWSDRHLHERIAAYTWLIENYYRYYQFYGNTLIALVFAHVVWRSTLPDPLTGFGWLDASLATMVVVLFAGSRSALSRYYRRASDLLASS